MLTSYPLIGAKSGERIGCNVHDWGRGTELSLLHCMAFSYFVFYLCNLYNWKLLEAEKFPRVPLQ